jgi:deoxyadenosine/deoxycytidine kinase
MVAIVIDGNIGSGKTTQLDLLERKGWKVQREPLDDWPLKEFYADPARWAFFFHMVLLKTQKKPGRGVIYERSLFSSRYAFWPVLLKRGLVTKKEDEVYDYFWNKIAWMPDLFIYLSKDPVLAYEHIQKRHQPGDTDITLEYLQDLDAEYKKMIMKIPCRVIVVNANREPEKIHAEICRHLSENNELFIRDSLRQEVQEDSSPRRQMQCTPFEHLCRLS